jgi:hypothetical protein
MNTIQNYKVNYAYNNYNLPSNNNKLSSINQNQFINKKDSLEIDFNQVLKAVQKDIVKSVSDAPDTEKLKQLEEAYGTDIFPIDTSEVVSSIISLF